jgi:GT2 family glycosyltransferase
MANPTVALVFQTFNGERFLEGALGSVERQTVTPEHVIVVDNGSSDGTVEKIRSHFPWVKLVQLDENTGFGNASNVGMQKALDLGADYILLLNQDVVLGGDAVERLVSAMESHPRYGILSALQLCYDGSAIDPTFRGYALESSFYDDLALGQGVKEAYLAPFVPAAAVIFRRSALERAGGFDPLFFLYGEDEDLCRRYRQAGWSIGFAPGAVVRHWHGLVNGSRSFGWKCNYEYSSTLNHLKASPRYLPTAFATLVYGWAIRPLQKWPPRLYALGKCLVRMRAIARHRSGIPFKFHDKRQPRAESASANNVGECTGSATPLSP